VKKNAADRTTQLFRLAAFCRRFEGHTLRSVAQYRSTRMLSPPLYNYQVFQGRDDVAFTKATALMALAALEAVMGA
jgi:hypothetical protein